MRFSLLLLAQAFFALVGLRMLIRRVLPELRGFSQPALVLDVWAPLALVLPMLAFVSRVGNSVADDGWMVVGGPMACAALAMGMAMIRSASCDLARRSDDLNSPDLHIAQSPHRDRARAAGFSAGIGGLLLLLGAAN